MRFAYCGSDYFSDCLCELISLRHQLVAAFCHPVDNVTSSNQIIGGICRQNGITLKQGRVEETDVEMLSRMNCEFLLSAAYAYRIPADSLSRRGIKGMNIHPSLLPEGRGPWPLPHIILKGMSESGVTIHKLAHRFDAGDLLCQERFPVLEKENYETLLCKMLTAAATATRELFQDFESRWENAKPQQGGSYWKMPTDEERTLDFSKKVSDVLRTVRAFGRVGSYTSIATGNLLVKEASGWNSVHSFPPGSIISRSSEGLTIAARDGMICLKDFQAR
jgi:methionyl-tRNA formyltransferase